MQKPFRFRLAFGFVGMVALAVSGCGRSVRPMEIASNAGAQAVAKYDANHDGALDYDELAKAPGLQAAVAKIKKLTKGHREREAPSESELRSAKITAEEIDARIQEWKARGTGRVNVVCRVVRVEGGGTEPIAARSQVRAGRFLGAGADDWHWHDRRERFRHDLPAQSRRQRSSPRHEPRVLSGGNHQGGRCNSGEVQHSHDPRQRGRRRHTRQCNV